MESQFTSGFWHWYIVGIVVASFIFVTWILLSQNVVKPSKKGEEVKTTGHSWDGIEEYNNGLPRWWFYMFIGTILFGIGYLYAYPGLGDYKGIHFNGENWTRVNQYKQEMKAAEKEYAPLYAKFAAMKVEDVAKDPEAMTIGKNLFNTYCIQCHGSDAQGARGFPNLTDIDWLHGGTPEKILETITNGRLGVMQAWGPVLGEERVKDAANYVMSLSGKEHNEERAARGKEIFAANCAVCHGPEGHGNQGMAPNLSDDTWLWSGSEKGIIETITGGRHNQMPAWGGFLNKEKLHLLTSYVWGISHPDNKALPTDTKNQPGNKSKAAENNADLGSVNEASVQAVPDQIPVSAAATSSASVVSDAQQIAVSSAPAKVEVPENDASVVVENGMVKFYFASGKSEIAKDSDKATAEVVAAAKAGKKLIISGFTDSTGNAAANERLSKRRAQAVEALLLKQGVQANSIELRKPENTVGAQGRDAEGRRVEVAIKN